MRHRQMHHALAILTTIGVILSGVVSMAAQSPETLATSSPKPVALGPGAVSVTLAPVPSGGAAPLWARVANVAKDRKVYLVLKSFAAKAPPEAVYQVYLGLPSGETPKPDGIHYVGTVNFFNATSPGGGKADPRFYSFDVTDLVQALRARKSLGDTTTATIVPAGRPNPAATPQIGEIALVAQ